MRRKKIDESTRSVECYSATAVCSISDLDAWQKYTTVFGLSELQLTLEQLRS